MAQLQFMAPFRSRFRYGDALGIGAARGEASNQGFPHASTPENCKPSHSDHLLMRLLLTHPPGSNTCGEGY